jgi:hypothetical protein
MKKRQGPKSIDEYINSDEEMILPQNVSPVNEDEMLGYEPWSQIGK